MKYIVLVTFDRRNETAFNATLPAEGAHIQRMKAQGVVEAVYVSLDGSRGWTILPAESEEQVKRTMQTFPLFPYMHTELIQLFE